MSQAKNGDKVKVHYTGKLNNGQVFDSSMEREPIEFTLGEGQVIKGFETALQGMALGEKKTVTISPDDAYGQNREDLVGDVPRNSFPPETKIEIGQRMRGQEDGGRVVDFTIIGLSDDSVKIDANHPLAGEDLTFELELVEIL